ncbi:phosphatidylserine decarboxylase [Methylophaga lonarensis MPL]|uniref:Phosphatidylserine decarboxylase proenzyme n=1 Tax=Methylophaga lonarensis MPL TaxID=1286106 RepID=M7NT65_9GAMM|nr:archaetidylserine decarboxylase [Methylophaga lonarensis]EMR11973.1 phosphatidylserine decarboxylase [Methylophaga lonarensis MPL]
MNKPQKQDETNEASGSDRLLTLPQYLIPQHFLSVIMHRLTQSKRPWLKQRLIRFVASKYQVNMAEAANPDLNSYPSFNAFFTRSLKSGSRPLEGDNSVLASPVDGVISQLGAITNDQLIQAKGRHYRLNDLLAGDEALSQQFSEGQFATIYLSPRDYHRIHMPLSGRLLQMTYIPGKLFSVNPRTVRAVPDLFARNERLVTVFETAEGPMVLILVGAIFVGSMETVWSGQITPPYGRSIRQWHYDKDHLVQLEKGQEMGRFNMGSTVIILLPKQAKSFASKWQAGTAVKMGQALT